MEEVAHEHMQVVHKVVVFRNVAEAQVEDSSYHVLVAGACSGEDHHHSQGHWQSKEEDSSEEGDPIAAELASVVPSVRSAVAASA